MTEEEGGVCGGEEIVTSSLCFSSNLGGRVLIWGGNFRIGVLGVRFNLGVASGVGVVVLAVLVVVLAVLGSWWWCGVGGSGFVYEDDEGDEEDDDGSGFVFF